LKLYKKTILAIIFSFIIAFSSLVFFLNYSLESEDIFVSQTNSNIIFKEKLDDVKEKIFLMGSSQIGRFNETAIEKTLAKNGFQYDVFNVATTSDRPTTRLNSLDMILEISPKLVVYGIGYRDFGEIKRISELDKPRSILPDPEIMLSELINVIEKNFNYNFENLRSPKSVTVSNLKKILNETGPLTNQLVRPKAPFYITDESNAIILSDLELRRAMATFPYKFGEIKSIDENKDVSAVIRISEKLEDVNIELVIVTMPYSKYYQDQLGTYNKNQFEKIINYIENETKESVYRLDNKYINALVWNTNDHIAIRDLFEPNIDLTDIIMKELSLNVI